MEMGLKGTMVFIAVSSTGLGRAAAIPGGTYRGV